MARQRRSIHFTEMAGIVAFQLEDHFLLRLYALRTVDLESVRQIIQHESGD